MSDGFDPLSDLSNWQLYRVSAKVRPLPWHPMYYEWQFGVLSVWLFANSIEDSRERAMRILDSLPYELLGEGVSIESDFPPTEESRRVQGFAQKKAEGTGLAITLHAVETGGDDEAGFESEPL